MKLMPVLRLMKMLMILMMMLLIKAQPWFLAKTLFLLRVVPTLPPSLINQALAKKRKLSWGIPTLGIMLELKARGSTFNQNIHSFMVI